MFTRLLKRVPLALLAVLLFAGCSDAGEVQVDETDDGGQVTLDTGQTLVVSLPSNPSTGYSWEVESIDVAVLSQAGEPEYVSEAQGDVVGAGGTETFRFEAEASGTLQLKLIYHRPFEEGVDPIDTFTVTVEVR
jgi:inhibitor of cysteine peptidase